MFVHFFKKHRQGTTRHQLQRHCWCQKSHCRSNHQITKQMFELNRNDLWVSSETVQRLSFQQWGILVLFDLPNNAAHKGLNIKGFALLRLKHYNILWKTTQHQQRHLHLMPRLSRHPQLLTNVKTTQSAKRSKVRLLRIHPLTYLLYLSHVNQVAAYRHQSLCGGGLRLVSQKFLRSD